MGLWGSPYTVQFWLTPYQRKSSFPETEEKVRRLKRKNAELAVIAKRLEERAQKLQETNMRVVRTDCGVEAWVTWEGWATRSLLGSHRLTTQESGSPGAPKRDKCWPWRGLKVSVATRGKGVDEEAPEKSGSRILD